MSPRPAAPAITVITPTKNRLELLKQTLDSVQAQEFAAWEHIVVDDGSEDGTLEEVLRRAGEDPRVRLLRRQGEAGGANVCRNQGIRAARSELIVFLDSDDLLDPACLGRRVETMRRNADCDFVTFQTAVFVTRPGDLNRQQDPDLLGDDLARFLYFELPWIITAPTWRKESLVRLGLFDESLPSWQDVELHIRALTMGCRYLRFPEIDHHVRWQFETTKVSVEQRRSPRHLDAAAAMLEKFEQMVREGPGMNWVRQRALCSLYYFVAECWLALGRVAEARACWRLVRQRGLAPRPVHAAGDALLLLQAPGTPARGLAGRVAHKWKGWARLRTNPELVSG
jgi:glycosyltransferase involved in cell wall biosynthesis